MQDIHSIGDGGGRLFNGGGGGDRRLRPHHHQNHQALKCPRCDSLNTKFCYYNNYNLSQPRHFCKSCRRYWTKGGVLRNVPVGGGCRKTKRSKPKQNATSTDATAAATTTAASTAPQQEQQRQDQHPDHKSSNSHSSSESSSLTATNTTTANTTVEHSSSTATTNSLFNTAVGESKLFMNNPSLGCGLMEGSDCGIFSEIGTFTNLIGSSNENLSFGFSSKQSSLHEQVSQSENQVWQQQQQQQQRLVNICGGEEMKLQDMAGGVLIDQTLQNNRSEITNLSGGFGVLDWQGSGDHGLFDLTSSVDQAYWNQNQWSTDQDPPSLYLP